MADVLKTRAAPLQELKKAQAVFIEAPSITKARYEHEMLDLVSRIRNLRTDVMVIVQPSLRRKSNRTLWVQKWNNFSRAPFKFKQTCSCKTGNAVSGCHFPCMIGSTKEIKLEACCEVPTLSSTSESSLRSLCGSITRLASDFRLYPSGDTASGTCSHLSQSGGTAIAPCNSPVGPDRQSVRSTGTAGAQRTPN